MFNVINLIIVLILILFISGFAGYAVLKGKSRNLISTNIIAGLLIYTIDNYLFKNLTYSIVIQLAFGLFGIILFFKGRKQFDFLNRFHLFISVPLFFIFIYVFTRLAVLFPVSAWDARSIWFYHGKAIYFANSISLAGKWNSIVQTFSHPDYPKFFPLLIATVPKIFGFWNEFIPKSSLVIIEMTIFLFIIDFINTQILNLNYPFLKKGVMGLFVFFLLFSLLFLYDGSSFFLTSGYVDAFCSMCAVCMSFACYLWLKDIKISDKLESPWFSNFICWGGILSQLKQEGLPIAIIILVTTLLFSIVNIKSTGLKLSFIKENKFIHYIINIKPKITFLIPLLLWILSFGLYLQMNVAQHLNSASYSGNIFSRIQQRLKDFELMKWVFVNIFFHNRMVLPSLLTIVILIVCRFYWNIKTNYYEFIPYISGIIYSILLLFVYESSASDLYWQTSCSAGRVGGTIGLLFFSSCVLVIFDRLLPSE